MKVEEGDGDDTSDDRASDDEIKAANMGILQAREEEDDDEEPAAEEGQGFPQEVAVQGLHRSLQASAPAKAP